MYKKLLSKILIVIMILSALQCKKEDDNDMYNLLLLFLLYVSWNQCTPKTTGVLSVNNKIIVNASGNEIRFRGIQLDYGSTRGDSTVIDDSSAAQTSFLDSMLDTTVTEDDFKLLANMGANQIRLSLNTYKDFEIDSVPYTYRESNFARLDRIVELAQRYKIYLVISMRQSPGGHNSSPHSGNNGLNQLWGNVAYKARLVSLWEKIALRYKNKEFVAGYDLLNEPEAPDATTLNTVFQDISNAIRAQGSNQIIFLEGNLWTTQLEWVAQTSDKNTALSIHFYAPGSYATDGTGTYPTQTFTYQALYDSLRGRLAHGSTLNRPVYMGEFGAMSSANNYINYDSDVISMMEDQQLNWTYWNLKNSKGASTTQAIYYTNSSNAMIQLFTQVGGGTPFASFTSDQLMQANNALKTSNHLVKQSLKDMLDTKLFYCP